MTAQPLQVQFSRVITNRTPFNRRLKMQDDTHGFSPNSFAKQSCASHRNCLEQECATFVKSSELTEISQGRKLSILVWSMARLGCHPACVSGLGILRFGVNQTASDLGGGLTLGGGPHALYGRNCLVGVRFDTLINLSGPWRVWVAIQHVFLRR